MKKNVYLLVIVIIVIVTLLCGCSAKETVDDVIRGKDYYSDANFQSKEVYKETISEASKELSDSNIEDLKGFTSMVNLVSRTVWGRAPMRVTFAFQDLEYGGVKIFSFEDRDVLRRLDDDGSRRKLYAAQLELKVLAQLKCCEPSKYKALSVIVAWDQERRFRSTLTHSVCDLNGDGIWDYYSPDLYYDRPAEDDIVESELCRKRPLDDPYGSVLVIKSEERIRNVPPLDHTTFYDIQNAMKES
jgi:hypothetical protein